MVQQGRSVKRLFTYQISMDRGTRKLHRRLRVPQWPSVTGEGPISIEVSQAAVCAQILSVHHMHA